MADLQVGMTVWVFDQNQRVYTERTSFTGGHLIWAKHWVPKKIISETRTSWVLQHGVCVGGKVLDRFPKKATPYWILLSQDAVDDAAWVQDNRHLIAAKVGKVQSSDTLRQILRLIEVEEVGHGG